MNHSQKGAHSGSEIPQQEGSPIEFTERRYEINPRLLEKIESSKPRNGCNSFL